MKRESLVLAALVGGLSFSDGSTLAATIRIEATSKGAVTKGPFTRPSGVVLMTSDVALKSAQDYVKRYDGPAVFDADYTITLKPDATPDPATSMVTFDTFSFTADGKVSKSPFKTQPITITEVMLMNGDPTMIASFKFSSNDWYPVDASLAGRLNNKGLSGSINLKTGESSYTAAYNDKLNGAIYTYMVTGMIKAPGPFPDPEPEDFGVPDIFSPSPVPEPAPLAIILTAITVIVFGKTKEIVSARTRPELQLVPQS